MLYKNSYTVIDINNDGVIASENRSAGIHPDEIKNKECVERYKNWNDKMVDENRYLYKSKEAILLDLPKILNLLNPKRLILGVL